MIGKFYFTRLTHDYFNIMVLWFLYRIFYIYTVFHEKVYP
nr:MAG TPA: hypothetical protein [Caudoviricetes sp.]